MEKTKAMTIKAIYPKILLLTFDNIFAYKFLKTLALQVMKESLLEN